MQTTPTFSRLVHAWHQHPRYIAEEGGARSGKTYAIMQLLTLVVEADKRPKITSVVSETMPHLKRGAIRDFKSIMSADGKWEEERWSKSESIYTFPNGSILEFFSADQPGKVLGPARDRLFINEVIHIPWETARQLFIRTRDEIVVDYNPAHRFWLHERIQPKENCISLHSTYKDNPFLTAEQVAEIESNQNDANWWRVYGLGLVGELEGVIYDFEQIDALPEAAGLCEFYGMDFGFTNDPTACVHILADTGRRVLYADEVCFRTRMTNADICAALASAGVPLRSLPIYADCAEPKSIHEISLAGYNIKPCDKDAPVRSDKMKFQVDWMRGWKLCVTKGSINMINELRNYTWEKDKDGKPLNIPIDKFNHSLDALRYGCWTHLGKRVNMGRYTLSF